MMHERPPAYEEVELASLSEHKIDVTKFLLESSVQHMEKTRSSADPPGYRCTVSRSGRVWRKVENTVDGVGHEKVPFRRNWTSVIATVRGTKLEIHKAASHTIKDGVARCVSETTTTTTTRTRMTSATQGLSNLPLKRILSHPATTRTGPTVPQGRDAAGVLLQEYSLLGAVTGVACDYTKRENVIRVRAGSDQFLFECTGSRDAVEWLEAIQQGITIADPLESRVEPHFASAPRTRRTKTKNKQPYDIFEAASEDAPLRRRPPKFRHVRTYRPSVVRSVAPLNRDTDARYRKSGCTSRREPRKDRSLQSGGGQHCTMPERYVCAVLVEDFPRTLITA